MFAEKRIVLDPRLSMIAALVGSCECFADIGCDHGRLGAFMLQTGRCARAQLTDVSIHSIQKARRLIGILGLEEQVDFCVGDGAKALAASVDAAVIAGMGGVTIAQIIRDGREKLDGARLVLQPNVAVTELRRALSETGYTIVDEDIAVDGRRCYVVIAAKPGPSDYDLRQQVVGPVLLKKRPAALAVYAGFRLRVAEKALKGARAGGDRLQAAALKEEISIWKDVCHVCNSRTDS